ncbi:hypothetical protein ACLB2K_003013 [Fragaria x ananassa]
MSFRKLRVLSTPCYRAAPKLGGLYKLSLFNAKGGLKCAQVQKTKFLTSLFLACEIPPLVADSRFDLILSSRSLSFSLVLSLSLSLSLIFNPKLSLFNADRGLNCSSAKDEVPRLSYSSLVKFLLSLPVPGTSILLQGVLRLQGSLLRVPDPVLANCTDRRWKCFKNCLGPLDGTYIRVHVSAIDKPIYGIRKGEVATNVLIVCSRDLQFIFVLSGWEGSTSDSRVLYDAVTRPNGLRVPTGYYYLVDGGYMNGERFLAPYRGTRYHLSEWGDGNMSKDHVKYFNMKHFKTIKPLDQAQEEAQHLNSSAASSPLITLPLHPRESLYTSNHKDYKSLVLTRLDRDSVRVNSLNTKLQLALRELTSPWVGSRAHADGDPTQGLVNSRNFRDQLGKRRVLHTSASIAQ